MCFVLDYVELRFDDYTLTALADPIVFERGTEALTNGRPGYKDALCRQIGGNVTATVEDDRKLEIEFDSRARIVIPLDADSPAGPEMALLSGLALAAYHRPE